MPQKLHFGVATSEWSLSFYLQSDICCRQQNYIEVLIFHINTFPERHLKHCKVPVLDIQIHITSNYSGHLSILTLNTIYSSEHDDHTTYWCLVIL